MAILLFNKLIGFCSIKNVILKTDIFVINTGNYLFNLYLAIVFLDKKDSKRA